MKDYTDYINNISVDSELHDKILKRATQKPIPPHRNRIVLRYSGMATFAAILLLCVLTIPGLFNNHAENAPNNPSDTITDTNVIGTVIDDPLNPNDTFRQYKLELNEVDSQMGASIYIPGHFWYELTNEQLKAVLPDFPFSISATVNYRGDGSIFNVVAYETLGNGDVARFNELYTLTEIQFAPDEIMEDVIYEYEPKTSDVYGISVVAGVFDFEKNDGVALYIASFKMEGIAYSIKLHDSDNGESGLNRLTETVNAIIRNGAADLSVLSDPTIPELRDEKLTITEAYSDTDFGAYMPESVPTVFTFDSAQRLVNQDINGLFVHWYAGLDYIEWRISKQTEYDREHIVSASELDKYDLSLYPIPRADSVPAELREYVYNPVFLAEEFTLDVIKARAYQVDDKGDTPGWRMDFSVLFDGVVVRANIKGASPEQIWEMFAELKRLSHLNKNKQAKIQKQLDEDEQNE